LSKFLLSNKILPFLSYTVLKLSPRSLYADAFALKKNIKYLLIFNIDCYYYFWMIYQYLENFLWGQMASFFLKQTEYIFTKIKIFKKFFKMLSFRLKNGTFLVQLTSTSYWASFIRYKQFLYLIGFISSSINCFWFLDIFIAKLLFCQKWKKKFLI